MDIHSYYHRDGERLHSGVGRCLLNDIALDKIMWRVITKDEYGYVKLEHGCPCNRCALERDKPESLECKEVVFVDKTPITASRVNTIRTDMFRWK